MIDVDKADTSFQEQKRNQSPGRQRTGCRRSLCQSPVARLWSCTMSPCRVTGEGRFSLRMNILLCLAKVVRGVSGNDIQPPEEFFRRHFKHIADAKQGCQSNRPSSLDLLPVAGGETEREHVLLAVAALLTHGFKPRAEFLEDNLMLYLTGHIFACKTLRAKTPRAD